MLIEVDVMFEERFDVCIRVGLGKRIEFKGMRNEGTEVFKYCKLEEGSN